MILKISNKEFNRFKSKKTSVVNYISSQMTKCRLMLHSGYYPETWNHRHIHSLHKNDSKKDPSNNRGITLGSALGKLYRWLTCNRIGNEIESKNILLPSQAGFGKNYRTTGHKFTLFSLIKKALSKRKYLYTYLVDFRKAYDSYVKNACCSD